MCMMLDKCPFVVVSIVTCTLKTRCYVVHNVTKLFIVDRTKHLIHVLDLILSTEICRVVIFASPSMDLDIPTK